MSDTRIFKKLSTALKEANGNPFLRIGDLYVIIDGDETDIAHTSIELLDSKGNITGEVRIIILDTIGNVNRVAEKNKQKMDYEGRCAFE